MLQCVIDWLSAWLTVWGRLFGWGTSLAADWPANWVAQWGVTGRLNALDATGWRWYWQTGCRGGQCVFLAKTTQLWESKVHWLLAHETYTHILLGLHKTKANKLQLNINIIKCSVHHHVSGHTSEPLSSRDSLIFPVTPSQQVDSRVCSASLWKSQPPWSLEAVVWSYQNDTAASRSRHRKKSNRATFVSTIDSPQTPII